MRHTDLEYIAAERNQLSRGAPFFSLMVVGLAVLAYFDGPKSDTTVAKREPANCEAWDREAVDGITPLIYANSAAAELKLSEALTQLHRARMYCRAGAINVARNDYASLHRTFPTMTGSVRAVRTSAP